MTRDGAVIMMTGRRRDGLQTLGLCAVVIVGVLVMDQALERWDAWEEEGVTARPGADTGQAGDRAGASSTMPDVKMTGFQFLHVLPKPEAKPLWVLTADTAALFEQRQEADLQTIHAAFQPEQESSRVVLSSDRGRFDLKRLNFEVSGQAEPVTMQLAGQYRLTTSRLTWDNGSATLTSDQPVTISGQGLNVSGVGFDWVQPAGTVLIRHDVTTVITP